MQSLLYIQVSNSALDNAEALLAEANEILEKIEGKTKNAN